MNWEQKLEALNGLAECSLLMRKPGDWYVHQGVELKEGGCLIGTYGNGKTPEDAVGDHWKVLVLASSYSTPIVINAMDAERRQHIHWNGYRWVSIEVERKTA